MYTQHRYHADTSVQQVNVVEGADKLGVYKDHDTKSGIPLKRKFCTVCGSNVFINSTAPEDEKKFMIVALGTLDEKVSWRECWVNIFVLGSHTQVASPQCPRLNLFRRSSAIGLPVSILWRHQNRSYKVSRAFGLCYGSAVYIISRPKLIISSGRNWMILDSWWGFRQELIDDTGDMWPAIMLVFNDLNKKYLVAINEIGDWADFMELKKREGINEPSPVR
jgi:hypothetical protein